MKLTNISLAILVAIGLVACGGSDNKNNPVPDPEPKPKPIPGNDNPPPPPKGDSALDPKRAAPDLTVADDVKNIVAGSKRLYVDRGFSDTALGYDTDGTSYDEDVGTDPADVKLTSTYKFLGQNDIVTNSVNKVTHTAGVVAGDYTDASVGAIYVGDWTNLMGGTANAYVKFSGNKYGRVKPVPLTVGDEEYTPKTKFEFVNAAKVGNPRAAEKIPQKEVVFIANANGNADVIDLGTHTAATYDVTKGQVLLNDVTVFGTKYSADSVGKNLEFGDLTPMREIQTAKVTGSYTIINNKNSAPNTDDKRVTKSIDLGTIKAYNLPYSTALVTTNIDKDNPLEKNIFNLNSSFQVFGFQTVALPQNGRALYKGKSFNAKNTGDVTLYADFFEDRAGMEGVIDNRKDHNGNDLATLSLKRVSFLGGGSQNYQTGANNGLVTGDDSYATKWTVQLYGPEAEEAAGTLVAPNGAVKEVYNTQRGALTNKSNDDATK